MFSPVPVSEVKEPLVRLVRVGTVVGTVVGSGVGMTGAGVITGTGVAATSGTGVATGAIGVCVVTGAAKGVVTGWAVVTITSFVGSADRGSLSAFLSRLDRKVKTTAAIKIKTMINKTAVNFPFIAERSFPWACLYYSANNAGCPRKAAFL